MTRTEALRTLLRYMPQRSIHITETTKSFYHAPTGDRNDEEQAIITILPGVTHVAAEAFVAPTVSEAVKKVLDAIGSVTLLNVDREQARAFEALNCEHDWQRGMPEINGDVFNECSRCGARELASLRITIGPLIESGFDAPQGTSLQPLL